MVSARLRRIRKRLPCEGERQIHADNISTQQPPSRASTSSVRTQPLSYRGPTSPEKQGDALQVTPQHDDLGLILPISSLLHPSTRATKTTHTPEGGELWALSYTRSPASHLLRLPPILRQKATDTRQQAQSSHQHQMKTDTQRRHRIHPDRHLLIQQMTHTGAFQPTT